MECKGAKLCDDAACKRCFERSFASHEKSKYWSEENEISPRKLRKNCIKKFKFNCDSCNHRFEANLNNVTSGFWCPYCANRKLCDNDECIDCFNKSFASHEKSKLWDKMLNSKMPREVFQKSKEKYFFMCKSCGHSFNSRIDVIKVGKLNNCPFCVYPPKRLCDNNDCIACFNKSFASHEKSVFWSDKNPISPRFVFKSTPKKFEFKCGVCNHHFLSSLSHVSSKRMGWCPYCANQKLCDNEDCNICHQKSFASHEKAKWWSEENTKKPRNVFKGSNTKYKFICGICDSSFVTSLSNTTRDFPRWCPFCKNKTEKKFHEFILRSYPDTISQYKDFWCFSPITKKLYSFDFFIPSINVIIEIDGDHHFRQVANWDSLTFVQSKDIYKMKLAYDRKISIIRIPYKYIYSEKFFEKYKIIILEELKRIKEPKIVYLCDDTRYDHMKQFNFDGSNIPTILE